MGTSLMTICRTDMERKKYLEMCRDVAEIKGGIEDIRVVPDELKVIYRGIEYYPVKYELGFRHDGSATHTAIIHDLTANAVVYAELARIEPKGESKK